MSRMDFASNLFDLPPRRESFLARYPRNVKMTATVILLALIILPPAFLHGRHAHRGTMAHEAAADKDTPAMPPIGQKVAFDLNAPSLNDQDDASLRLVQAPDARITEDTELGSLPRIGEDGQRPWQVYARPFNGADKRPRIAILITGLGMSRAITDRAIAETPRNVTLAFSSQSPVVGAWTQRARQAGHETLMQVPMEPFDFPRSDPGPDTLLTSLPNSENLARLTRVLRRASGYVGILSVSGSHFTTDNGKLLPVLDLLHDRGLMAFDARSAPHSVLVDMAHNEGVPVAAATLRLDSDLSPDAIAAALDNLEKTARQTGRATGIAYATPVMVAQLQQWAKDLPQRGIALAPITAMVQ